MLDQTILTQIKTYAETLEKHLDSDVIYYHGPMHPHLLKEFRNFIEKIVEQPDKKKTLCIFLKTPGGLVEPVEKMVEIIRHHYEYVHFVIPDMAMSAGTIFCMSGDKIYMDYSSSLGPIDPQVLIRDNGTDKYVPALGYLDKVESMILKSTNGTISPAEFAILQNQNLALLSSYEQARDLSIDLLKKWLVLYKFKSWTTHKTTKEKIGQTVTIEEKTARAEDIARLLGDHKHWHSHGRMIGAKTLRDELKLEIEDYTSTPELQKNIRLYNDVLTGYIERQGYAYYLHNRTATAQS